MEGPIEYFSNAMVLMIIFVVRAGFEENLPQARRENETVSFCFNRLMCGSNKRSYVLKQTCS